MGILRELQINALQFKKLRGIARKLDVKNYVVMSEYELKEKLNDMQAQYLGMNYPLC
ncbi:MAG: hypothetical protein JKY33_00905 [Bacteroidia bacterium]|nr:hypothetical protein [Bacteroidia bacterium]